MRIVVRVVPRATCVASYLMLNIVESDAGRMYSWLYIERTREAHIFPCASYAQAAIDGFMAQRDPSEWHCDIQDADDPESGPLEPVWTGPDPYAMTGWAMYIGNGHASRSPR